MQASIHSGSAYFWQQVVKLIKKRRFREVGHWLERFYEVRVRDKQQQIGGV